SGLFVFSGKLFGTLTADSAVLSSTFNAPVTLSRAVGGHLYTVTIGPFSGPSGPNSDNVGSIGAHVDVTTEAVQQTPEPTSLALAGLGLAGLAGGWRWRRRAAAAA